VSIEACAFCNITSEPERIIRRGNLFTSFLSNPRLVKGHVLVIPNDHVEDVADLSLGRNYEMFEEIQRIILILRSLGESAMGTDVWTKTRLHVPEGEIKINHLHTHLIPSGPGTEIYDRGLLWTPDRFSPLPDDERDEMRDLLTAPKDW
jgi:diadenosine tetraphosphate (Ap4A) HIT family hydrolase